MFNFNQSKYGKYSAYTENIRPIKIRKIFKTRKIARSKTRALQPINPMGELGYFHHLKQRTKEQKLARKRTVERCDCETNIVVIKPKNAKSVPDVTEIEIDTLD